MGLITLPNTISNGNTSDAAEVMANFNALANEFNGNIDNLNIKAAAGITESKLSFNTISGHNHDGSNSKAIVLHRAFTFAILGSLSIADEQGIKYIVPEGMTVISIRHKCTSGSGTIRLQKDTTDIDAGIAVTSSVANETTITSAALTAGQVISLDITASSSMVDLFVTVECTEP